MWRFLMRSVARFLISGVIAWLAFRMRSRARPEDVQRQLFRHQTRGMGLRMTDWLRDRARPRWLRVRD